MKKYVALICITLTTLLVAGCITNQDTIEKAASTSSIEPTTTTNQSTETTLACGIDDSTCQLNNEGVKVEVYHFHRTRQCWSCKTLGALAEKTVNTYFEKELESGKLKFAHINIELPKNAELANKYGATGSSLMIGTYSNSKFTKEEDTNVWYKLNNEEDYLTYLKEVIEAKLKE